MDTQSKHSSGVDRVKLVISRKGLDSESGVMASPILSCGCLYSVPIPSSLQEVRYADIKFGKHTLQHICNELKSSKKLKSSWSHEFAHLDPDLRGEALAPRPSGWRAAFGQSGGAATHLIKQAVSVGDLFIFFGWFRKTIKVNGKLAFDPEDGTSFGVGSKLGGFGRSSFRRPTNFGFWKTTHM